MNGTASPDTRPVAGRAHATPAEGPLRVVLVDDHVMILKGLKAMLAPFGDRVLVVGEATDADSAVSVVAAEEPDVVLCDVRLRAASGLDLCRRLIERDRTCRVILLSVYDDQQYLFQALRAGASGYLLKRIDGEELVRYLLHVRDGETVIDPTLAGQAVGAVARLQKGEYWPGAERGLTHRESEVLALLVAGLSNRAIAARLTLGEETVKSHVGSLYRKLDVTDRTKAVAVALREGIFR